MATIKPFKAIRPNKYIVDKVATLPYDVMNSKEARRIAEGNPYSFLHIDKSEIDLDENIDLYDEKVYLKARENLDEFRKQEILVKDDKECIYIYKQIMDGRAQVGIVACISVDESLNGTIKKHEYTRPEKEIDRTKHIKYCDANTGTILVTYKHQRVIDDIINDFMDNNEPLYDFITDDKIEHTVWKIDNDDIIDNLVDKFEKLDYLYIADGHHRTASAENVAKEMRAKNPNYTGKEEFNYFIAMIAPDENLMVLDYNRVIKDLNGLSEEEFINKIKENFELEEIEGKEKYKPDKKGTFGMYLGDKWYKMKANKNLLEIEDPVDSLDISILQDYVIDAILGIDNPRVDKRIDFIGGIRGLEELEKRVNEDMKVAFAMYPTSIEDLIRVADANKIMPAKSTWFEPKVRCGLFLHEINE